MSLLIASVGLLAGCGDSGPTTAPVKGKVLLYGKPYPDALVVFEPKGGGPAGTSRSDEEGNYEIYSAGKKGAVLGSHKVVITTIRADSNVKKVDFSQLPSDSPEYQAYLEGASSGTATPKPPAEKIPAKYNTQSDLVVEVKSGTNDILLDLK